MRLVTHTCSNTEIVAALGLGDCIVGVDDHSDYPAEVVQRAARIGPDNNIDIERIKALKPDLVLTSLTIPGHDECLERLRQSGLPIMVLEPTHLDHVPRDIRSIAKALNVTGRGERLAEKIESAIAPRPCGSKRPQIAVEWWPKPVIVPGRDSWVTQMLDRAGAENPWAEVPEKSVVLDPEQPPDREVDAIIISWCGVPFEKYRPDVVKRRVAWKETGALRQQRIVAVSEAYLGRPGPRLIEGMRAITEVITGFRG